jgi:hypothetical protein
MVDMPILPAFTLLTTPNVRTFQASFPAYLRFQDRYRYWDATRFAEYLYRCVAETIRRDLREEIGFLSVFDRALSQVMNIIDMPDRRASLLVKLIMQSHGVLSKTKWQTEFPEVTVDEVKAIEERSRQSSSLNDKIAIGP